MRGDAQLPNRLCELVQPTAVGRHATYKAGVRECGRGGGINHIVLATSRRPAARAGTGPRCTQMVYTSHRTERSCGVGLMGRGAG